MIPDNLETFMYRSIELARNGLGNVAPNPMVGCVIVNNGKIIGEGYHRKYGEAHAEVNAINSVKDKETLKTATLYVNLEPCAHHGKTPPCTDLILKHKIPKVFIGCIDSSEVSGKGIERLKQAGCNVIIGILEDESRALNERFFTMIERKRPFIILKWAQTMDGFIAQPPSSSPPPCLSGRQATPPEGGERQPAYRTGRRAKQPVGEPARWKSPPLRGEFRRGCCSHISLLMFNGLRRSYTNRTGKGLSRYGNNRSDHR